MLQKILISLFSIITFSLTQDCEPGFTEINDLCFHSGDLSVLQKMIDNSYESGIDLGCSDGDSYCGSPNPYMGSSGAWFWVTVDSVYYEWTGDDNGVVDPLELGIQEWNNGRLTGIMCGAYIYCQLSGPIPEEIGTLTEATTLRFEYNYFSGFVPNTLCDLDIENENYLEFDFSGNRLCPPYPECLALGEFWYQDSSECTEIGDVNFDYTINIQDVILLVSFIVDLTSFSNQQFIAADINFDEQLNVLDVIGVVDIILQID